MAASANALTSRTNLKEFLGIATADTSKDAALDNVIDRVTLYVEGELNRKLKARKYNGNAAADATLVHATTGVVNEDYVYFSGWKTDRGGDTLRDPAGYGLFYLPAFPVRPDAEAGSVAFALAPLLSRDETGETWGTPLTPYVDYVLNRETGEIKLLGGCFTPGVKNYRVTACAGYVAVPADLEGLALEFCKQVYRDTRNLQSESIGTYSRSYNRHIVSDPYVEGLLAKYRRIAV